MNDKAIQVILDYLDQYPDIPSIDWPQHWFEEVSFSNWAVGEILNAIMDHPYVSAKDTIEEFELKMSVFQITANEHPSSRIFSVAAQTAREFLEMI